MHDVCYHFPQVSEYILALEYPEVSQLPGLPSGLTKSPKLKAAFEILLY